MNAAVPEGWQIPKWLTPFNKTELAYLAERLDSSNRQLRAVNQKLAVQLNRETQEKSK